MTDHAGSTRIPQPPMRPIVGNALEIDSDAPVQSMMRLAADLGPVFRMSVPGREMLILSSRELVVEACDETRFEKHVHGPLEHIRDFAGDGLFTAYGEEPNWARAHRILMPAFGPAAMRNYFDDMIDIADQMLTKWERLGADQDIDVADNMTRLTLDTIALSGFGYRFNSFYQREMHPFIDAMVRALSEAGGRSRRVPLQNKLMFVSRRQYEADAALMHDVCDELIARRRQADPGEAPRDLLGLMLSAADPRTGERLDDANIRNQLVTFLIAGHETTSGLLSFAVHLLLDNPDVLRHARDEVDRVLGAETPRFEHLSQLGFIDQILRETLRLYPTAPAFAVHAKHDTVLAERYPLKKGDVLFVLTPSLHRDPSVWAEPERFDPARFAPGARENLPDKAWLPFGNGSRSCIGRAFALQEATLVLSMLLQRFEFRTPRPYDLKVRETLTLKPEGLRIRARVRQTVERPAPAPEPSAPPQDRPVTAHGTPLLLLYGSDSGASEAFARRVAGDGAARGYTAQVAPLDEHVGRLPTEGAVVVVTASYNGRPPDNARDFVTWLSDVPPGALEGVRYAVFGCGSRDWLSTYQAVPTMVDERLHDAGAQRVVARGEADAGGDFFGDFERWYAPFWERLGESLGVKEGEVETGPLYEVEVIPSPSAELVAQNRLGLATVVENRELVDVGSPLGRSKRHIEFALPEGTTYQTGDYLTVLPENHPELVERAARRFGIQADAAVVLHSSRGAMAASLPTGQPLSVRELLGHHVELSAPATRKDLERLAEHAQCPPDRDRLSALAGDPGRHRQEILDRRVSVLDLLDTYPSLDMPFGEFLDMLPAMRVRQYSISSSPRWNPAHCTLTVGVVDAPALSGVGRFRGISSTYLARLRPGDRVPVAVRRPNVPFQPPASNDTPVIMIAAGTGVAPFRGFVQDRALRKAAGEPAGETLLFFGCDHPDVDFLYREELARWEADGVVRVLPAFTHQPEEEVTFVQHRVWRERDRVRDLFRRGATVYVCGDGRHMAPAVRENLARIYQDATGGTGEQATAWIAEVERNGRYVSDVFG
ncbi:bifunctional cytochrome P450/NADPH--P450 reductase [Streptosporangium canum]|uniref:bifunctional cytochrome P450/NADPH--P450 reductase n=1 Tax=Streptosporangium canum TaxID=324952 RepID=UPI0037B65F19